jgi:hypothetical protein
LLDNVASVEDPSNPQYASFVGLSASSRKGIVMRHVLSCRLTTQPGGAAWTAATSQVSSGESHNSSLLSETRPGLTLHELSGETIAQTVEPWSCPK